MRLHAARLPCDGKALRDSMATILVELQRIEAGAGLNDELLEVIRFIAKVMDGMKEDIAYGK